MEINLMQIFKDGKPYDGGPNLLNGTKECPLCKSNMIKKPLGYPYIKKDNGCVMVNISQTNGIARVYEGQFSSIWACEKCVFAQTIPKKRQMATV